MMHRLVGFSLLLVIVAAASSDAHAQAWVGDQGALDLNFDYNLGISDKVVYADGDFPDAGTTTHQFMIAGEYVPVRNLAVNLQLPLVLLKYTGDQTLYPHPGGGSYDDGDIHATLTDLRAGARYQVLDEPVAVAPHLAFSIPVADYETVGNTVAGRHLKMAHLGLSVGYIIGTATYLHALYEFTLAEKYDRAADTEKHGQNRSDVGFTIGHKLLDYRLDIHLDVNYRMTHGGLGFDTATSWTADELLYHDALLEESMLLIGGGVGYQINNQIGVTAGARIFATGKNTQNASVFALGLGWTPL